MNRQIVFYSTLLSVLLLGCNKHPYLAEELQNRSRSFPKSIVVCTVEVRPDISVPEDVIHHLNDKLHAEINSQFYKSAITIASPEKCLEDRHDATHLVRVLLQEYRERRGGEYGSEEPAKVALTMQLIDASDLSLVWRSHYERADLAVSQNLFLFPEKVNEGFHFKSADYLLERGIAETTTALRTLVEHADNED